MLAVSTSDSAEPPAEESQQVVAGEAGSADKRFGLEKLGCGWRQL